MSVVRLVADNCRSQPACSALTGPKLTQTGQASSRTRSSGFWLCIAAASARNTGPLIVLPTGVSPLMTETTRNSLRSATGIASTECPAYPSSCAEMLSAPAATHMGHAIALAPTKNISAASAIDSHRISHMWLRVCRVHHKGGRFDDLVISVAKLVVARGE